VRKTEPITKGLGWVVLLALVLSALAWGPALRAWPKTQNDDGQFFHKMLEVARVSVVRFHELPLWNPWECGGVPMWDNPQGIAVAPLAWLTFLVGTTRTLELWYVIHTAMGLLSMWALARIEFRMSPPAAFLAAASWAFAGVHFQHCTGGHVVWVCYFYFPLAILFWRRAEHDLRAAVGLGCIGALTILEGGTYPLPYLAVLLGLETLTRLWPGKRVLPIAKAAGVVVLVAFGLSAMRFLPVLDQLTHHSRGLGTDDDRMHWATFEDVFLAREHGRDVRDQTWVWPEYGNYLGPILLWMAGIGVLMLEVTELWALFVCLVCLALMLGAWKPWAPWAFLNHHVYPFKQMRVPSRFVVMFTLFLSVFIGLTVDRLPRRLPFPRARWRRGFAAGVIALGLVAVGDVLSVGATLATTEFTTGPQDFRAAPSPKLFFVKGDAGPFLDTPHRNKADMGCWEEWAFERDAPLWMGDEPQARGAPGAVKVVFAERTPNTFVVDVDVKKAGRMKLNSTYDRGWRSSVGQVVRDGKMLSVDLPEGKYTVKVWYWPYGLTLGFWISGLSFLLLLAWLLRPYVRRRFWKARGRQTYLHEEHSTDEETALASSP
jgi:hypothetical protein